MEVVMPDATVNIGGDASGAVAAVAAAQAAIDGLSGKTVNIDVNVRQNGAGIGGLTGDLGRAGDAADRVNRAGRGMGDSFDRAGRSAHGLGDHVGRAADQAERLSNHLDAVNRIMTGGAPSSTARATGGMRDLANEAERARGSIGGLGSQSSRSLGAAETGAIRAGDGMRQLGSGASSARQFMAGASGAAQQMSRDLVPMAQGADGVYRSVSRMSGAGKEVEKFAGSMRTIDAAGRAIDGGGGGRGGGLGGLMGGLLGGLGDVPGAAIPASTAIKAVGLSAGVSALGMGVLAGAVAGVGLAGVAGDFIQNRQLMKAGSEAVKDFTKQFSAMKAETSAAGMPAMAGVSAAAKGMGHELAQIGATNMAPVLNDVAKLGNQATQAMQKLAPSIGPATQGLTALAGAVIGAFGDSGPAVTSFADTVTKNAGGLQALTSSVIDTAGAVGNATVDTLGGIGQFDSGVGSPSGKPPGAKVDTSSRPTIGGGLQGALMSALGGPLVPLFLAAGAGMDAFSGGAPGGPAKPVAPGGFDPSQPFSGMLPDGQGGFTTGTGTGLAPKAKPARGPMGNFDSKGAFGLPTSPPAGQEGASPDASRFAGMTGGEVLTSQRAAAGLPPVGQPQYSGVGPRGPGQSVGPMPASAAVGLSGGAIQPFNNMMQAAGAQVAGGGASTGTAMVQHIQKAVQTAAPAAAAGGAAIGGAMNTGMAQGSNSTQTVIDTVTIKHSKRIIDIAKEALGVHSPSTEFDWIGQMTWAGFGRGQERASRGAFGAMGTSMGGVLGSAQSQAHKFGYDYQDGAPPTVSYNPFRMSRPDEDPAKAAADRKAAFGIDQNQYKPGTEGWWSAHDNRAAQLAAARENRQRAAIGGMTHDERRDQLLQNRAGLHERALANLHISGHAKPSGDVNPFAADQARSRGLNAVINPFSQLPGMFNKAGQNSAQGLSQGMSAHVGKIQASGAALAGAGHAGYKKKDKQSSPSAEWAAIGGNSVAGAIGGVNAGIPSLAAAGVGMAGAMQDAAVGPMSDSGLQIGYTWSRNVVTGAQSQLKTADFQAGNNPDIASEQARVALGLAGNLGPGAGASVYKNPSVSFGGDGVAAQLAAVVQAAQGSTRTMQPIVINLEGQPFRQMIAESLADFVEQLRDASIGGNG